MNVGHARLSRIDTTNFLTSKPGSTTDWTLAWMFAGDGPALTRAEIDDHLHSRAPLLDAIDRRIATTPGSLDYPYWVRDGRPFGTRIEHPHPEGVDWVSCVHAIEGLGSTPLDATDRSWRLLVFDRVLGAPGTHGDATIVVAQLSHALITGPSIAPFSVALFGVDAVPLVIDGLGQPVPKPRPVRAALTGIARMPIQLGRQQLGVYATKKAARTAPAPTGPAVSRGRTTAKSLTGRPSSDRVLRTLELDQASLRGHGVSLTIMGLTALSVALERYLAEIGDECPPAMSTLVTVHIRDGAEAMGVNRLGAVLVDLHTDTTDLRARAIAIAAGLAEQRKNLDAPTTTLHLATHASVPYPIVKLGLRALERTAAQADPSSFTPANLVATSVNFGDTSSWSLCGRPYVRTVSAAAVPPTGGIMFALAGTGKSVTVSIHTSRATVPDPELFVAILRKSFDDVTSFVSQN